MTSVRQLAKLAGVSPSTVSRVLRHAPYVRPEIREHVLDLAARLAYRPQTEQTHQRCAVGCILPTVSDPYSARMLSGITASAYAEAYRVIVMESHSQLGLTCQALHRLLEQHVAGVLLFTGHEDPLPSATLFECWSRHVALVKLAPYPCETPIDTVCSDGQQYAEVAARYLHQLGHRHILVVGRRLGEGMPRMRSRVECLALAVRHCGLQLTGVLDSQHELPAILRAVQTARRQRPTAVLADDDAQAAHVLCALLAHGVRVPRDVSLLGGSNLALCEAVMPRLTSVDFQPEATGRIGFELVLRRAMAEDVMPTSPETIALEPQVIVRESCAPPCL